MSIVHTPVIRAAGLAVLAISGGRLLEVAGALSLVGTNDPGNSLELGSPLRGADHYCEFLLDASKLQPGDFTFASSAESELLLSEWASVKLVSPETLTRVVPPTEFGFQTRYLWWPLPAGSLAEGRIAIDFMTFDLWIPASNARVWGYEGNFPMLDVDQIELGPGVELAGLTYWLLEEEDAPRYRARVLARLHLPPRSHGQLAVYLDLSIQSMSGEDVDLSALIADIEPWR